jgi:hypothetical protein
MLWLYFAQVLKESFKIYCAINDGIINLVDKVKDSFYVEISCAWLTLCTYVGFRFV